MRQAHLCTSAAAVGKLTLVKLGFCLKCPRMEAAWCAQGAQDEAGMLSRHAEPQLFTKMSQKRICCPLGFPLASHSQDQDLRSLVYFLRFTLCWEK